MFAVVGQRGHRGGAGGRASGFGLFLRKGDMAEEERWTPMCQKNKKKDAHSSSSSSGLKAPILRNYCDTVRWSTRLKAKQEKTMQQKHSDQHAFRFVTYPDW